MVTSLCSPIPPAMASLGRASSWIRSSVPHSWLCFASLGTCDTALSSFTQLFTGAGREFLDAPKWKERNPESAAFSELDESQSLSFSKNITSQSALPMAACPPAPGHGTVGMPGKAQHWHKGWIVHGQKARVHSWQCHIRVTLSLERGCGLCPALVSPPTPTAIMESFGWGKLAGTIESNHSPCTAKATTSPCPHMCHICLFKPLRRWGLHQHQGRTILSVKKSSQYPT